MAAKMALIHAANEASDVLTVLYLMLSCYRWLMSKHIDCCIRVFHICD